MSSLTKAWLLLGSLASAIIFFGGCKGLSVPENNSKTAKNYMIPLTQGKDGLWEINKRGSLEKPVAIVVKYSTGKPYATGAAYDCRVYARTQIIDRFDKASILELNLGILPYQGSGIHQCRFLLPNGIWGGETKAIGLQQIQPGMLHEVWLEMPTEVEYPN